MGYLLQNGGLGMAGDWIITGGRPLQGRVEVPAAKNSVLPLLAASLLCSGPVRLQNVPRLTDVEDCLALLRGVGCTAGWQGAELAVQGQPMRTDLAPEAAGRMRASILFCAPLLARLGRVSTVLPGGCRIGARPIDLHLQGLAQMGVRQLPAAPGQLTLYAPAGLRGAEICLSFPSVGATETLLLAAATAQGQTVLHGAAKEPEIADLAAFLNACGGCVEGAGTDTIRVQGRRCLAGCTFMPVADRIIASTLACAAAGASPLPTMTSVSPSSAIRSAALPIDSTARAITPSGAFSQPRKSGPSGWLVRSCICASNRSFSPESRSGRLTLPHIFDNSTSIIACASFSFAIYYTTLWEKTQRESEGFRESLRSGLTARSRSSPAAPPRGPGRCARGSPPGRRGGSRRQSRLRQ